MGQHRYSNVLHGLGMFYQNVYSCGNENNFEVIVMVLMTSSVNSAKFCACVSYYSQKLDTEIFVKLLFCIPLKLTFIYKKSQYFSTLIFF